MQQYIRLSLIALGASVLASCAGAPTTRPATVTGTYSPRMLEYVAGKGGMLTEVVGNPFSAPKSEVDAAVLSTMETSHFGARFPFFSKAPEGYSSPYRVVVALDPAPGTSAYTLCAGNVRTQPRGPSDPNRVVAAFCARERVVTANQGLVYGPTGPRDPAFVGLIAQLSQSLFPPNDQERNSLEDKLPM